MGSVGFDSRRPRRRLDPRAPTGPSRHVLRRQRRSRAGGSLRAIDLQRRPARTRIRPLPGLGGVRGACARRRGRRPCLRRRRRRAVVARQRRWKPAAVGRLRRSHKPRIPSCPGRATARRGRLAAARRPAFLPLGHLLRAVARWSRHVLPARVRRTVEATDRVLGTQGPAHRSRRRGRPRLRLQRRASRQHAGHQPRNGRTSGGTCRLGLRRRHHAADRIHQGRRRRQVPDTRSRPGPARRFRRPAAGRLAHPFRDGGDGRPPARRGPDDPCLRYREPGRQQFPAGASSRRRTKRSDQPRALRGQRAEPGAARRDGRTAAALRCAPRRRNRIGDPGCRPPGRRRAGGLLLLHDLSHRYPRWRGLGAGTAPAHGCRHAGGRRG